MYPTSVFPYILQTEQWLSRLAVNFKLRQKMGRDLGSNYSLRQLRPLCGLAVFREAIGNRCAQPEC